jgi:hypothetical protein
MATTRKPKVPKTADDKEQSERFIETARKYGADETGKELEQVFKAVVPPKRKAKK